MEAARAQTRPAPAGKPSLSQDKAGETGLSQAQIEASDSGSDDGSLKGVEPLLALAQDRVSLDKASVRPGVTSAYAFVDEPSGPGPRPDLHPGYHSLNLRDPLGQTLEGTPGITGKESGDGLPAPTSLQELSTRVTNPTQVSRLLSPFGYSKYDFDRAKKGTGTPGAQSPQETFDRQAGICRDSHQLGAYVLQQNGYEARQTSYQAEGVSHAVLTYEGKQGEGFGLIEYGTHYSPEAIAGLLGRPALSHAEALLAVRPEAKAISIYSQPEAGRQGTIESIYYSLGHQLYQETLRLKHENSAQWDAHGASLEMALGDYFGLKLQANGEGSPDPTTRQAVSAAAGLQLGNERHWLRASAGAQYRPREGHHLVGTSIWETHPTLMLGARLEAQLTPLSIDLGEHHRLSTTLSGEITRSRAMVNQAEDKGSRFDSVLAHSMNFKALRIGQHLDGRLSESLGYRSEVFLAPDLMAHQHGTQSGGSGLYANSGANASLHYTQQGFGGYLGAQYLFSRINNLEASGASTGMSYSSGAVSARADNALLASPEGLRIQTRQSVDYRLYKQVAAYGFAGQEQILNEQYGHFNNPSSLNMGLGLRGKY